MEICYGYEHKNHEYCWSSSSHFRCIHSICLRLRESGGKNRDHHPCRIHDRSTDRTDRCIDLMDEHTTADIQISDGGSGVGVTAAKEGTADIGMLSRELKDSEKEGSSLQEFVIANDGIALIANPSNTVLDLDLAQIKNIYQVKITNWKELGGTDMQIVLIGRDSASGTRGFFT